MRLLKLVRTLKVITMNSLVHLFSLYEEVHIYSFIFSHKKKPIGFLLSDANFWFG